MAYLSSREQKSQITILYSIKNKNIHIRFLKEEF